MSHSWYESIARYHTQNVQCVLSMTGGGASLIGDLLSVPGASNTILESLVPYANAALTDWLGRAPEQACSSTTALSMAMRGYLRADQLARREGRGPLNPVGLGCTAALVSSRPKRGAHRVHIAVQSATATCRLECELHKGARDRADEERVVARLGLGCLWRILDSSAANASLSTEFDFIQAELTSADRVQFWKLSADPLVSALLTGADDQQQVAWSLPDGTLCARPDIIPTGVLCGAFNPLHEGHVEMRAVAERILGGPVWYELSIGNVDKPPLDFLTIEERRRQFAHPLALTNAPTFVRKSRVLPNVTFVVGADTAARIIQPKYYGHDESAMRDALKEIRDHGCRFLTAARVQEGTLNELSDLSIPAEFADLFQAIPADAFCHEISSSEIRQQRARGD